ncbi:MAG: choice-of-anchor D domain-containing protein [Ignavibacteria bacterium]|nr:choice-of-anchor D domain-containing protein [Ignavibacteria bacterium]
MMKTLATILVFVATAFCAVTSHAQRWEKVPIPAPYNTGYYLDIFFLPTDPNYGWACDENGGYVIRTVDGGKTWQGTQVLAAGGACHLEYIQFLNQNVGYCSGPCGIFKSVDGGATWQDIKPPGSPFIWGGWFRNANEGWFTGGGCGYNAFLRTMDGGATFQMFLDTNEKRSALSEPYRGATMPANTVYAIGSGTLWRSQSDGVNWQVLAYTGTSAPWHEELAMYGNAICVPAGGTKCNTTPGLLEGIRFSPDLGQTWREFDTGEQMFGSFLHDADHGWAAGWNQSVYYTSNAGQNWQLRNCGLEGANTDDILFLNNNDGWVVGNGVFRTAPALRTQSDTTFRFRGVCPDSAKRDTVMVRNINWFASPWSASITGPDAIHFRIVNAPISATIASCTPQPLIIEYRPRTAGNHVAVLNIQIQNPDTTLIVLLEGDRREPVAYPIDTLVTYTERVGVPVNRTLMWRTSSGQNLESIVNITRVSGDTNISLTVPPPALVRPEGTLTYVAATARDTGWIQAKFRVRLAPCTRDTFITVRIYGISPIFNSIVNVSAEAKCETRDTLRIPISNTGNAPLTIRSMTASNLGPQAFIVLGFVSGRFGAPWVLQPLERDTVLVEYRSQTGNDNATMIIENDDLTLTRGPKSSWQVALRGVSLRPVITITPRIVDLGSMCTGTQLDRTITFKNESQTTTAINLTTSSPQITGLTVGNITLLGGQSRQVRFTYTASRKGPVLDTIRVRIQPCDTVETIIVRGMVEDLAITITPPAVLDSADVNTVIQKRFVIRLATGDSATIYAIRMRPLPFAMITGIPNVPFVLRKNDSAIVTISWSSPVPAEYVGFLDVEAYTTCSTTVSADVRLRALSTDLDLGPPQLQWTQQCTSRVQRDSVYIDVKGGRPVVLTSASIRPVGTPFRIVGLTTPLTMSPGTRHWIVVEYNPQAGMGLSTATLDVVTDAAGGTFAVPLRGSLLVPDVIPSPTLVDFGTVEACLPKATSTVKLDNRGTLQTDVDVTLANAPRGMRTLESRVTIAPSDSAYITIEIDPSQLSAGTTTATIFLYDRICGTFDTISVTVVLAPSDRLVLTPDPLDLGTLEPMQNNSGVVTISNPSVNARTIVELRVEPPTVPWRITASVNGQTVAAGGSLTTTLEYAPTSQGVHDAQLVLVDVDQCTTSTAISLKGRAQDPRVPPTYTLRLHIDDYVKGPNERVSIPVYWDTDVHDAMVDSLRTYIAFNELNLFVDSISAGTMQDAVVDWTMDNDSIRLLLRSTGPDCGRPGVVAVLHGVAFSAIPDSTELAFTRTTIWATEAVNVLIDDGSIIVDACGPRFMIQIGAASTFRILPPLPARDVISVEATAKHGDFVTIEIVDGLGNIVRSYNNMKISEGASVLQCSTDGLASGIYGVRVTSGSSGALTTSVPLVR